MTELYQFIKAARETNNEFDFNALKIVLQEKLGEGLKIKEDDDLALISFNDRHFTLDSGPDKDLAMSLRSVILEKTSLNIVASQHNNIIYNTEAIDIINKSKWDQIVITPCYEGSMVTVFYYKDKWRISTHTCLDAYTSRWGKRTYGELFADFVDFKFEELDSEHYYNFIIVHKDNKHLIEHTTSKLILSSVINKNTHLENNDHQSLVTHEFEFKNLQEVLDYLSVTGKNDFKNKKLTTEGVIVKVYDGEKYKSPFKLLKIQTNLYANVQNLKPNHANVYANMLELYQRNKLGQLSQFILNDKEVVNQINNSIRQLSVDILNLYHNTRNKNNEEIYNSLSVVYKQILFKLHGIFKDTSSSVKIRDVYYLLKGSEPDVLRKIYIDYIDHPNKFFNSETVQLFAALIKN